MTGTIERKSVKYENLSGKFTNHSYDYSHQFCSIYRSRLKMFETMFLEKITQKWGTEYPICKLHHLAEEQFEKCIVIGTLFKDQKLKPSVLKQLAEHNQLIPQPLLTSFTDDSDKLFVEDELQRYEILGCLNGKKLVTGITVAMIGTDIGSGKFEVDDYIFYGCSDQIERPLVNDDTFIVFLSGLDFINHHNFIPQLEMFMHRISGVLGDVDNVSKIVRIVIAGNCIRNIAKRFKPSISMTSRRAASEDSIEAVKLFDKFLSHLCPYIDIDVMPGENDPSNHMLPQKEMHFCMFPESAVFKTVNLVSNPYFFSIEGTKFLGSSGQPVTDILRYSEIEQPIEALENCLKWAHIAPTAPDTLSCYPLYDKDPFIIEESPHVMFAGNQPNFATKMVDGENGQKVRIICIPQFANTFEAVFLNLKNMDCHTVKFDVYS